MIRESAVVQLGFVLVLAMTPPPASAVASQPPALPEKAARVRQQMDSRITQADREAAAENLKALKQRLEAAKAAARKSGAAKSGAAKMTLLAPELPPGVNPPGPGDVPDYFTTPNWAFSPPLRKFVDTLAGLGPTGVNNLHNYIPVAVPDTITYPGSDYYEIELREFRHQFHSDLHPTTLRGYVQVNEGTDASGRNTVSPAPIQYLGPVIVAERNRPVRVKFTNKLPTGAAGMLNIPVDTTIMGAGQGPLNADGSPCNNTVEGSRCAEYAQNRAVIHLHGGRTPWISDGTPHQFIVPDGEETPYQEGVSLFDVPDMPDPGPGATTYYFSNQQSARLMFYHDHAWGITRLNVLVGMAAGYLITDEHERALVADGVLPAEQIPLIIQDRTFVDAPVIRDTDPTWNWGSGPVDANGIRTPVTGDLWIPHVYMPAQNPFDMSGASAYGRWLYGPWFFPPTDGITYPPIPNPYHDPNCDSPDPDVFATCTTPGQPPLIPATPTVSVGMETFFDTQTVNGVAFPTTTVEPKAYRFRILNASNDRFINLSLYEADATQVASDGRTNTEIRMVPASAQSFDLATYPLWPTDGREGGVPDPARSGPPFVQIGTEGGFLPRPVVIPSQPIGYFTDPTAFWVGNVKDHALLLGPAERADVVIDFSRYAGRTLILYNDAPTAFPALDVRTDFYAGAPEMSDTGGYGRVPPGGTELEGPQVGFGPNTRTVMQIQVAASAPAAAYDVAALNARFAPDAATGRRGVFESSQEPIIVGQAAYNGVYSGVTFPPNWPYWGISRIQDDWLSFKTVSGVLIKDLVMEPKGIHDEMGAAFDPDYGRMSGNLGMTNPNPIAGRTTFTLYDFTDPPTEILYESVTPPTGDGTQIWKISHNGVDTHPIHFHIFDVQLVNRVGWDGQILLPEPNEMGWKDTIRISPLMDTIVAMRPTPPALPFNIPDSVRLLNPGIPPYSPVGFTNVDPITQEPIVPPIVNEPVSFGWEYVWHCHILSHEEMDMMRPIVLNVVSTLPAASTLSARATAYGVDLAWNDPTPVDYVTQVGFGSSSSEIGFRIERADGSSEGFEVVGRALANATAYRDPTAAPGASYRYRVVAYNQAGDVPSNEVAPPAYVFTPATGVTLTASPASPSYVGVPVTFTAAGQGSPDPYSYRFSLSTDGGATYAEVQGYGPSDTWTMPGPATPATYRVKVEVRTASTSAGDASAVVTREVRYAPATGVTLTADKASPVVQGTPVTFTATGQGSAGYQFQFGLWAGSTKLVSRDWSTEASWTIPTNLTPGTYAIQVVVRTAPVPGYDALARMSYVIRSPSATGLTVEPDPAKPSPHVTGTSVVFTANASGSSGYEYMFNLWTGSTKLASQAWSTNATWEMPANQPPGSYVIQALVRTNPFVAYDAVATVRYDVILPPATGITVAPDPENPSPHVTGTPVVFTATATGSSGYEYLFNLWAGSTKVMTQGWSTNATWTMPADLPAGSYAVQAFVRTSRFVSYDAVTTLPYQVRLPPPATLSVVPDPGSPSPHEAGTSVVFTAIATGSSGYEYVFNLWQGSTKLSTRGWGIDPTWTMPADQAPGTYVVQVLVRTSRLVSYDLVANLKYQVVAPNQVVIAQ